MLAFDKAWEVPSFIPRNLHRKALIRLSTLPEQDIVKYLRILDLPAARITRRPSLGAIPFCYMYFVEAFDRNDSAITSWRATVEKAIERARATDAEVNLIGIW